MNIASYIEAPAMQDPERWALILEDGRTCSYLELRNEVQGWAATFRRRGLGSGRRIAVIDWGGVRSTAATLAAASVGGAAAHMNPLLTGTELVQLIALSGCSPVAVVHESGRHTLADIALEFLEAPDDLPSPEWSISGGGEQEALVLFTSGTTGLPKPVAIAHDGLHSRVSAYRPPFAADRAPNVSIMSMPSFHVGGLVGLVLSLYGGDTTVVQSRFDAGRWLQLVAEHRVASAMLVPTMLTRILDHPDFAAADLRSLKLISYGAAAAPEELVRRAMDAIPRAGFANVFGQTETLGAYTTLTPDDHRDPRRIGSVGKPMPGVELRVVDPDTGRDVERGEIGELWVNSPLNVSPGWLHTGDLARVDADGYVYPSGRRSETINRGGEKFGPAEIESVVATHPGIAEVAVAGIADAEMGERVGVAVVASPGSEPVTAAELRDWCRGRLAPFKLPEVVVTVDALPYNELGKLPRRTVARLIEEHA